MTITDAVNIASSALGPDSLGRCDANTAKLAIRNAILAERERIAGMAEQGAEWSAISSAPAPVMDMDSVNSYRMGTAAALRAFAKSIRSLK